MKDSAVIYSHFRSAQISYSEKYMLLYSAFNAWYRMATGTKMDIYALRALVRRDALWVEYSRGESLENLRPIIRKIAALSQFRPLKQDGGWNGVLSGADDWKGMIYFWHAVRCDIVHGNAQTQLAWHPLYIHLAYDSLNIYMTEIVLRLQETQNSIKDEAIDGLEYQYGTALKIRNANADLFSRKG